MQKNHIQFALQNDKQYLISKRKILPYTKPKPIFRMATQPSESLHPPPQKIPSHPIISSYLRKPSKQNTQLISRAYRQSRCSSASSRSSKQSFRSSADRKIQHDNIRMVEKILLVKPTQQRSKEKEFFKQHREVSRRISRYSQKEIRGRSENMSHRSRKDTLLPVLNRKKTEFSQYFKNQYHFTRKPKSSYSFL